MARLASTGVAELADNVLWLIERRLQVLEEVALDPEGSATGGISGEEAYERYARALEQADGEAKDEVLLDLIRAGMREWWPDFPEKRLLANLYRRAARRETRFGAEDSSTTVQAPLVMFHPVTAFERAQGRLQARPHLQHSQLQSRRPRPEAYPCRQNRSLGLAWPWTYRLTQGIRRPAPGLD